MARRTSPTALEMEAIARNAARADQELEEILRGARNIWDVEELATFVSARVSAVMRLVSVESINMPLDWIYERAKDDARENIEARKNNKKYWKGRKQCTQEKQD